MALPKSLEEAVAFADAELAKGTPAAKPASAGGSATPTAGTWRPWERGSAFQAGDVASNLSIAPKGAVELADSVGSVDDRVRLELGGRELLVVENYDVELGVLTQPAAFSVTLGHNKTVADLIAAATPNTPFKLYVGETLMQTGFVDGFRAGGAEAKLEIHGRDTLQAVHDSYTYEERTFTEKSHVAFIQAVYRHAGLEVPPIHTTNEANRKALALGVKLPPPATAKEEVQIPRPVKMDLGDRYFDFIKRVLDRAGLFLFAAADGSLVLMAPQKDQEPLYHVVHAPADVTRKGSVIDYSYTFSTVDRCSLYIVYARGGGKKFGAVRHRGEYLDDEMAGLRYKRVRTFRDWHVQSNEQAELMARRRIAEERRRAWQLHVTVMGHRVKSRATNQWLTWAPDTTVRFDSDQLNLHGVYYIENVRFHRGAQGTRTELRLMRPEDLIFGIEAT